MKGSEALKVVIDRDLCVGLVFCISAAPTVFELDSEQKAVLLDPGSVSDTKLMEAARSCPVDAIILKDKEGDQVYP